MCGITGIFSADGLGGLRSDLLSANNMIDYRGPDGAGFALFGANTPTPRPVLVKGDGPLPDDSAMGGLTLALGHRRLAIIDLTESGFQPMSNADGSLWITYNGEIYNYLELRNELVSRGRVFRSASDTEVLLQAYEEWGDDCVNRFNGMWAFAIADFQKRRIFCSRDRFGVKPFHYHFNSKRFVFGSEIKQILRFPFTPRKINDRAVYEYLAMGAVDYCEETFFEGINKLPQGHNLVFDLNSHALTINRYYNFTPKIDPSITHDDATLRFREIFTDSVRFRLRSDVEVGSCLSGGLDSSSIVCVMSRLLKSQGKHENLRTFSSHFDDEEANEIEYMNEAIAATGVRADFIYPKAEDFVAEMEKIVWRHDEPFFSTSVFAQWSVFKLVHSRGVKVMLDGQGADELMAGYKNLSVYYFMELAAKKRLWKLLRETRLNARLNDVPWAKVAAPHLVGRLKDMMNSRLPKEDAPGYPPMDWINSDLVASHKNSSRYVANQSIKPFGDAEYLNNALYQLTFMNNIQALLRNEDRNSMSFSVESRVPFLDYRLVEFLFSLPSDIKIRGGYTKRVLRDAMDGILPEKIRWRVSKLGFATPEKSWLKTALPTAIEDALYYDGLRRFIDTGKAKTYLDLVKERKLLDFSPWRWVNLHLWMKLYELG